MGNNICPFPRGKQADKWRENPGARAETCTRRVSDPRENAGPIRRPSQRESIWLSIHLPGKHEWFSGRSVLVEKEKEIAG